MSATNNIIEPIKVTPLENGAFDPKFNNYTITTVSDTFDNIFGYTHIGTYNFLASSYYDDSTRPGFAFDSDNSKYWQCDTKDNPTMSSNTESNGNVTAVTCPCNTSEKVSPSGVPLTDKNYTLGYSLTPYTKSPVSNSGYRGGGDKGSQYFTTNINGEEVPGEWLQIEIPSTTPLYLFKYSIIVPEGSAFPTNFVLAGSKTGGKTSWEYIDMQTKPKGTVFNVNSIVPYTFFRLIICEMPTNTSIVKISSLALYGVPTPIVNRDIGRTETFTGMYDFLSTKNNRLINVDNNYSNYSVSTPVIVNPLNTITVTNPRQLLHKKRENVELPDTTPIIASSIIISILAISLIYLHK